MWTRPRHPILTVRQSAPTPAGGFRPNPDTSLRETMPVTDQHIAHFREFGYVALPDFLNQRETAALQAEVARFQREGLLRNVHTEGDGQTPSSTKANLQLIPLYDKSDLLRALPFQPRVLDAVERLIGDPFILHLDQMFLKPARSGSGTDWHQDNAYFKIADPLMGTAMWLAVHDANAANGTLRVIPSSFRQSYAHERDPYSNHHIHCSPPEEEAVTLDVPAGGAAFFCYGTAHCTGDNRTEHERAGLAFHFLRTDFAVPGLIEPDRQARPHLTGPEASGGLREYGVKAAGTWDYEVERALATDSQTSS